VSATSRNDGVKTGRRTRPPHGDERRGGGLRPAPAMLARLLDPAARRRGLVDAKLLTDWPAIVGPQLAARCQPLKLGRDRGGAGGVLHLGVSGAAAPELQHSEPQVIERINSHFGYPAVARLRLVHAPIPRAAGPSRPSPRALATAELEELEDAAQAVADPGLRAALVGLGRTMRGHGARPERRRQDGSGS